MTSSDHLVELARILAEWVEPASNTTIYLFGSRVRGDYRLESDVDVVISVGADQADMAWWIAVNADDFKSINEKLPGPLQILESDDPITREVRTAPVVLRDRQVICVWREPKPKPGS